MRFLVPSILFLALAEARSGRNIQRQSDDPMNDPITCRDTSFSEPKWYLYSSRAAETYSQNGTKFGTVGFNAQNIPTGLSYDCIAKNVSLTATGSEQGWHICHNPKAQFKFDLAGSLISIREAWTCGNSSTV